MKVTAKDVAARAEVSVSAVSRAFRPNASIAEETRARILRAADELGYATPSGQAIATLATNTIALVAGDLTNPFYPSVLEELSQQLMAGGRRLILHVAPAGRSIDTVMQQVLDYRADAAIITSATLSSRLARVCHARGMPVVLFNRMQPESNISAVCCDNYAGGFAIGRRMAESGRRRLAFLGGRPDTSTHIERWRGFSDALDAAGRALHARGAGDFAYNAAFDAMTAMLRMRPAPDSVFCCNDVMALAAIDAAKALGVRVPDDLAVIGFDDIPMAAWQSYSLTTMRQRIRMMLREALTLIDQIREDPAVSGSVRLAPGKLIERTSG